MTGQYSNSARRLANLLSPLALLLQDKKLLLVPWMIVVALTAAVDVTHIVHVAVISEVGGRGLADAYVQHWPLSSRIHVPHAG